MSFTDQFEQHQTAEQVSGNQHSQQQLNTNLKYLFTVSETPQSSYDTTIPDSLSSVVVTVALSSG